MNSASVVALASAVKDAKFKAARGELAPGCYDVDTIVHIRGTVEVQPDYQAAPTASIPLKATLALVLRYAGITGEKAKELLTQAMTEALQSGKSGEDAILDACPVLCEVMRSVEKTLLASLPKVDRKGALKTAIHVIELPPAAAEGAQNHVG